MGIGFKDQFKEQKPRDQWKSLSIGNNQDKSHYLARIAAPISWMIELHGSLLWSNIWKFHLDTNPGCHYRNYTGFYSLILFYWLVFHFLMDCYFNFLLRNLRNSIANLTFLSTYLWEFLLWFSFPFLQKFFFFAISSTKFSWFLSTKFIWFSLQNFCDFFLQSFVELLLFPWFVSSMYSIDPPWADVQNFNTISHPYTDCVTKFIVYKIGILLCSFLQNWFLSNKIFMKSTLLLWGFSSFNMVVFFTKFISSYAIFFPSYAWFSESGKFAFDIGNAVTSILQKIPGRHCAR